MIHPEDEEGELDHAKFLDECVRLVRTLIEQYRWIVETPPVRVTHDGQVLLLIEEVGANVNIGRVSPEMIVLSTRPLDAVIYMMREFDRAADRPHAARRFRPGWRTA